MKIRLPFRRKPKVETRAQGTGTIFFDPSSIPASIAPTYYSPDAALKLPSVTAAVRLLSNEVGAMRVDVQQMVGGEWETVDADDPDAMIISAQWTPRTTKGKGLVKTLRSMMLFGFAAIYIARERMVEGLIPMNPKSIQRDVQGGSVVYRWSGGGAIPPIVPPEDVIWIDWVPPFDNHTITPPLKECWEAIRSALAATLFAGNYFERGATPEVFYKRTQMESGDTKDLWKLEDIMRRKGRRSFVPPPGIEPMSMGGDPTSAKLVDLQNFGVQEVARVFGIPPTVLQDLSRGTYSNYGQSLRFIARFSLTSIARMISDEISIMIYPEGTRRVVLDVGDMGDESLVEKWTRIGSAVQSGLIERSEGRVEIGFPEDPPGETEETEDEDDPEDSTDPQVDEEESEDG